MFDPVIGLFRGRKKPPVSGVKIIGTTRTQRYELFLKKGSSAAAREILEKSKYPVDDAGLYGDKLKDVIHFKATDDADLANARSLLSNFIQ